MTRHNKQPQRTHNLESITRKEERRESRTRGRLSLIAPGRGKHEHLKGPRGAKSQQFYEKGLARHSFWLHDASGPVQISHASDGGEARS